MVNYVVLPLIFVSKYDFRFLFKKFYGVKVISSNFSFSFLEKLLVIVWWTRWSYLYLLCCFVDRKLSLWILDENALVSFCKVSFLSCSFLSFALFLISFSLRNWHSSLSKLMSVANAKHFSSFSYSLFILWYFFLVTINSLLIFSRTVKNTFMYYFSC